MPKINKLIITKFFFPFFLVFSSNKVAAWCCTYITTYLRRLENYKNFEFFVELFCESSYYQTLARTHNNKFGWRAQNTQKSILVITRPKYSGSPPRLKLTLPWWGGFPPRSFYPSASTKRGQLSVAAKVVRLTGLLKNVRYFRKFWQLSFIWHSCTVASLKVPAMIDYDMVMNILDTKWFPQHNIAGLLSGITFIVLLQSGEASTVEGNKHTHNGSKLKRRKCIFSFNENVYPIKGY